MEPTTAPQPDMAPELTPEEEQVSGAPARQWVCPDPRGLGRPRGRAPPPPRPWVPLPPATAPKAVSPPHGGRGWTRLPASSVLEACGPHIAPSPHSGGNSSSSYWGGLPVPLTTPNPQHLPDALLFLWPLHPNVQVISLRVCGVF